MNAARQPEGVCSLFGGGSRALTPPLRARRSMARSAWMQP
jgi:hypothetical protein